MVITTRVGINTNPTPFWPFNRRKANKKVSKRWRDMCPDSGEITATNSKNCPDNILYFHEYWKCSWSNWHGTNIFQFRNLTWLKWLFIRVKKKKNQIFPFSSVEGIKPLSSQKNLEILMMTTSHDLIEVVFIKKKWILWYIFQSRLYPH